MHFTYQKRQYFMLITFIYLNITVYNYLYHINNNINIPKYFCILTCPNLNTTSSNPSVLLINFSSYYLEKSVILIILKYVDFYFIYLNIINNNYVHNQDIVQIGHCICGLLRVLMKICL